MFRRSYSTLTAILLFLLIALTSLQVVLAGSTGKIAGKITDAKTGEPLVGVNVSIVGTMMGNSTNAEGEFFIINIPPGTYSVKISIIGYETVIKKNAVVIVDQTTRTDAQLEPTDIIGKEVVIIAERPVVEKDVTASKQIVTSATLEKSGAKSINEVLQTQAGFFGDESFRPWERGGTRAYVRGSSIVQTVFMVDNLSVNSGLVSDNYSGFNTSSIGEISILTGGYNAEYGEGRSAVVNVITKEAPAGIHGTLQARMRPAGKYHFGPNYYSKDNYDYAYFNQDYWTKQTQDANSVFYRKNADSLLTRWRQLITPNDTLANYANRAEYETEGTLFGSVTDNLSFLVSGRYKRGVDIFPQAIPYNPEFNLQGYLNYKFTPEIKLRIGGFYGGYESADYIESNFNTMESAQESGWLAPMRVDEQFARAKYNLMGAIYRQWPELRRWTQLYGKVTHVLGTNSFYEVTASYLKDWMDRSDRDHRVPDSLWSTRDDITMMVPRFTQQGYFHTWTRMLSETYQLKGDYTNQVTTNHSVKAGFVFKSYAFNYEEAAIVYSGNSRTNDQNRFSGKPYEGNAYLQDKIEVPGLVVNAGVRVDFFNQNRSAPKDMYDPLAFELATPGHDPLQPLGIPGTPELERTKLQVAVAPRIGISHPISENSVLRFVYGHFFQRPSWTKMFGFPFVNFTDNPNTVLDPYAAQTTFMQEWSGWYGNPQLSYERTIQYELGLDYNIADLIKLDVSGYYKDATHEADVITGVYASTYTANKALMLSNAGYSDVRGIETKIDSRFAGIFNFGLSHEIYWSFDGEVGFSQMNEPGATRLDVPKGLRQGRGPWANYNRIKGWAGVSIGKDEGPEVFGVRPLSDVEVYSNFWWRSGDQFTYHAPGDLSTEPNNMRWFNYYQIDLRVSKGFTMFGVRAEVSADIKNILDLKFLRLLSGDDLSRYMQNPSMPDELRLPQNQSFPTPNVWEWYTYEVPPRKVYLQFSVNF
jgi:hypothetical protein